MANDKLTDDILEKLVREVLSEDLVYKIKQSGEDEFQTFRDLRSFTNFVASDSFDTSRNYTVVTPQTDDQEATGTGATIKDKFLGLASEEPSMEPEKTGYLGELPLDSYRDDIVKLPDIYINAFKNSGFMEGDFENRIRLLSDYMADTPESSGLDEQFSRIVALELLEKIIAHITQSRVQKLKEGGFLFESFLCLLLSGTSPVSRTSYIDLIDNKLNNISIKFSAEKSSFYQAFSTVENYFSSNSQPMIHIMAVKKKISQRESSIIDFYKSEFTAQDYRELVDLYDGEGSVVETSKAVVIFAPELKYRVANVWANSSGNAEITLGTGPYKTGRQPRITFKNYGEKIGTLSLMPPRQMRQFSKEKMDHYDANIDLLFKELTSLRKNSIAFFSAEESKKQNAAQGVAGSYKNLRKYIKRGFKSRDVEQSLKENKKDQNKSLKKLDKLIEHVILEYINK